MKIGIFGGAFNPVHNGHMILIDSLWRAPMQPDLSRLEKLIIIPTANPPHRSADEFVSGDDRINMLRLALKNNDVFSKDENYKGLEISEIEFSLDGKSYTYNTIKALKALYPTDEFYLFMGSDQFLNFRSWYKSEKIMKIAHIVGFSRCEEDRARVEQFIEDNPDLGADTVFAEPFEVSSSEIRAKIRAGESIKGLVPDAVENYIREKALYV